MTKSARTQGRHAITSQIAPFPKNRKAKPPLKLSDWLARDLEPSDLLLGDWLTTTSRCLLPAQSGIGTNFMLALGMRSAAGQGFLHWRGQRAAKVLYIDGEMSRRLLKQRLADEIQRIGCTPAEFHVLSREDVEDFKPLNTPEGAQDMLALIEEIGGVDLAIFDSIMCLLIGSMSEEEPWAQTMQLVRELTRRKVGQIWVHHTGLDKSRGFGTNTREWQLDSVLHLEAVEQPGTDISFRLHFQKARERTPATVATFRTWKFRSLTTCGDINWANQGRSRAASRRPLRSISTPSPTHWVAKTSCAHPTGSALSIPSIGNGSANVSGSWTPKRRTTGNGRVSTSTGGNL
jgi:hypothetical protein